MINKKDSENMKKNKSEQYIESLKLFRFKTVDRVRFSDVDSFKVVHNLQYFFWLEAARTDYFRNLGIVITPETYTKEYPAMIVHAEIDYFNALRFGDEYEIFTRVAEVRNSSVRYESFIKKIDAEIIVKASTIIVHLDIHHKIPTRVPDDLRVMLKDFEKENIVFID